MHAKHYLENLKKETIHIDGRAMLVDFIEAIHQIHVGQGRIQ
jgi:hypothetical protein